MSVIWRGDKHALLSKTGGQARPERSIALEPRSTVLEEGCRRNGHTKASSHGTFLIGNLKERQAMKAENRRKLKSAKEKTTKLGFEWSVFGAGGSQLVSWPFKGYQSTRHKAINPAVFLPLPTLRAYITEPSWRLKMGLHKGFYFPRNSLLSPPHLLPLHAAAKSNPKEKY